MMLEFKSSRFMVALFATTALALFAGQATATAVAGKKGGGQIADYSDGVAVFTSNNDGLIVAADVGGQQFDFTPR